MSAVKTVLVVDDEPSVLRVASKVLRRDGYEILEALGGEEALRIAEEHQGTIDLLLTDVVMPGLGGRELGERFRRTHPKTRLLFMSGYTEDEVLLQGIRVAEVNYISKPFTVAGLRDKVREVLNGAAS
jgi:CheY-like chemotaxis protein